MSEPQRPESTEQRLAAARNWAEGLKEPEPAPTAPTPQAPPPSLPQTLAPAPEAAQMSDRLQTVMGAVERAAEAIRADAEEQARRHLAEAQEKADRMTSDRVRMISELTDDLIEHASIVRDHSEQMVAALERAITGVSGRLAEIGEEEPGATAADTTAKGPNAAAESSASAVPEGASEPGQQSESRPEPEEVPAAAAGAGAARPRDAAESSSAGSEKEPSAEVLLRATQLAIAGESREAIAARLRADFAIDPEPVLREVLG